MVNIKEILKERGKYPITKDGDSWLDYVLEDETKEEVWLITIPSKLLNAVRGNRIKQITQKYFVAGVYNLGNSHT